MYNQNVMTPEVSHPFTPERVALYKKAQEGLPEVRRFELEPILHHVKAENPAGKLALELGSGSGFLTQKLAETGLEVDTIDRVFTKVPSARTHKLFNLSQGLPAATHEITYDFIISLACLHHVVDIPERLPIPLIENLDRVSKPGTTLIFEDVPNAHAVQRYAEQERHGAACTARFFTEVIDVYSKPYHNGTYLDMNRIGLQLENIGWEVTHCFLNTCSWHFENESSLITYVRDLFNLDMTPQHLRDELPGFIYPKGGGVILPWGLHCLVAKKLNG